MHVYELRVRRFCAIASTNVQAAHFLSLGGVLSSGVPNCKSFLVVCKDRVKSRQKQKAYVAVGMNGQGGSV